MRLLSLMVLFGAASPLLATAQRAATRRTRPNVILITMDTLRADHLGCYGATNAQTPTLDSVAKDGVLFERAFSQVPLTWPSHAAILTGTYPFQNGVQDFTGHPLAPQFRSIAQAFKQAGYATGAVVSSFVLDRSWGLARGFDFYDDAFSATDFQQKDLGLVDRKAAESVTHALDWVKKNQQHAFFLWLHLYDPHSPYDPPEPFRTQYRDRPYDGEIAYADHELGRLITWLKTNHLYDNSVIVFLSDHGESLGDHGEKEHGFFIYNSTIHVPLIIKPAAGFRAQTKRVSLPAESIAVAPTLARLAGLKDTIEQQFQSKELLASSGNDEPAYSETFYPFSSFGWNPLHSVETSRYHYIEAPEPELYDIVADPWERKNIAAQQPATVAVLKNKLQQKLEIRPLDLPQESGKNLSPDAAEKLRALGYVAYQSPVSAEALAKGLPDPKTKLWEFNAILQAGDAFQLGNFPKGEELLFSVREKDPEMYAIPFMLGEAALRQKQWTKALTELQKALQLNPTFDQAMTALARALHETGDDAGARQWLDKALHQNAQNYRAWYELAWIESKAGQPGEAQPALEKALSIQRNFGPAQRDLGMLYFGLKDYASAAPHLRMATELGLKEASLFNYLGVCYSRMGKLSQAVASYQEALKLDRSLAEAHLNLAYAYQRINRPKTAQEEYGAACKLEQRFCQFVPRHQL
jgi:arylsulfatase A-like enzyme/Tfp pilus assembly protein PilF